MKNIAIIVTSLLLISCSKNDVKNIKKGTTSEEIEKKFGKPQNEINMYGYNYWRYNDDVVIIVNGKAEKVVTQKYLDSAKVELEKALKSHSKEIESLNEKTEKELEQINDAIKNTQEKLNKK